MTRTKSIDLRSDTVTRPVAGMYEAMQSAAVGDDVYGEDETVNRLEAMVAEMLGKQAALFVSSATQANLIAVLAHCGRGEEVLVGHDYHIYQDEAGGASALGGVVLYPLQNDATGAITVTQVKAAIKDDDIHCPISRLLCLENTFSGCVQDPQRHRDLVEAARGSGLLTHLDGARLLNAAVALDQTPADLCAAFDSTMICLSKGLGAPVGAVLCGSVQLIKKARRLRKMLGGGMRQAGILAACGLYALENHVDRLVVDHNNAQHLAAGIAQIDEIVVTQGTNMVFIRPRSGLPVLLHEYLLRQNILSDARSQWIRMVTHLDIDEDDIERVIRAIIRFYRA